ncbi:MAG: Na/Pi symporter [Pirellulaceae bacterium]
MLGLGTFGFLFVKSDRIRNWAIVLMGMGMVFFGLELMKDACAIIKEMPDFESWFHTFQADTYFGVLQCAFIGCLLTVLVQSSSATLGITISLAVNGIISYETAAALVLGENIGTTITAFLASLGATTNARRAAYFHVIFNICGVIWITSIFSWYIDFVEWLMNTDIRATTIVDGNETYPNVTPAIAAVHSIFNIANTLLFLPFVGLFVKLLTKIVPAKDFKEKPHLTDLDIRIFESPTLAIEQSHKEIEKMGMGCSKMLDWQGQLLTMDRPDRALADRLKHREQVLDSIQDEIAVFITNLMSGNVSHAVADEARKQLRVCDEYESVSDYIADLDKFDRKLRRDGHRFSETQIKELKHLNEMSAEYLQEVNDAFAKDNQNVLVKVEPLSKRIRDKIKSMRRQYMEELTQGAMAPAVSVAFLAALNAFARVRDHAHNIAEVISGEK